MTSPAPVRRLHRWLLLLPFGWQVALAPWANGVQARPFELPFPMAWQMGGIVFTTLVIALVFALDKRADAAAGVDAGSSADGGLGDDRPGDGVSGDARSADVDARGAAQVGADRADPQR
jgi:hypothetical protein